VEGITSMNDFILETRDLCYVYEDGTRALSEVNMGIYRGKTTAVLGGNGAGKTTLFLTMNGILKPSSGVVICDNKTIDYSRKGINELRRKVGIVFQDPETQLFSANVYQDVSFGPGNLKLTADVIRSRVEKSMEKTGIMGLRDKPVHGLSFGQKKRVAIAGVLAMEPEVIILDEPTAGLDPRGVGEIMQLIREMQINFGITVIIATHDIDIVPLYCDHVCVMDKGKVLLKGTPGEVFAKPEILRRVHLRLPRVAHLIEILQKRDGLSMGDTVTTISQARKVLKKWRNNQGEISGGI